MTKPSPREKTIRQTVASMRKIEKPKYSSAFWCELYLADTGYLLRKLTALRAQLAAATGEDQHGMDELEGRK